MLRALGWILRLVPEAGSCSSNISLPASVVAQSPALSAETHQAKRMQCQKYVSHSIHPCLGPMLPVALYGLSLLKAGWHALLPRNPSTSNRLTIDIFVPTPSSTRRTKVQRASKPAKAQQICGTLHNPYTLAPIRPATCRACAFSSVWRFPSSETGSLVAPPSNCSETTVAVKSDDITRTSIARTMPIK